MLAVILSPLVLCALYRNACSNFITVSPYMPSWEADGQTVTHSYNEMQIRINKNLPSPGICVNVDHLKVSSRNHSTFT